MVVFEVLVECETFDVEEVGGGVVELWVCVIGQMSAATRALFARNITHTFFGCVAGGVMVVPCVALFAIAVLPLEAGAMDSEGDVFGSAAGGVEVPWPTHEVSIPLVTVTAQ